MRISAREKFYYGVGDLGYSTITSTLSNFIMFFGTSVLGISGALMGLAVSLGVFWDAISDPIIGYYSDNLSSPLGKRHPFMIIGVLGLCAINLAIWLVPNEAPTWVKFIWILLSLLALQTFSTFFGTPHMALGLEMTNDPNEQTSIQCYRTVFSLIGMMLPTVFMFIFMPSSASSQGQLETQGYVNIAYASSILCLVFGLITIFGTLKRQVCCPKEKIKKQKGLFKSLFTDVFGILKKKQYRILILGYAISLLASSILTAAGMHMFTYCFHFNSQQISVLLAAFIVSAVVSQFIWSKISKGIGKKKTLIRGLSLGIIAILVVWAIFILRDFFSTTILFWIVFSLIFSVGLGTGVLFSFPISLFGDVMAKDFEVQSSNKVGIYSGIMTLASKVSNAFALAIIGVVLDLIHFSSSSPVQPLSVQNGLGLLVLLGTVMSLGFSISIFSKFKE